jgi:uncharacterized membrane protein (DUF2068 family)
VTPPHIPLPRSLLALRLIAVFKLTKAVFFTALGLGLLELYDPAFLASLYRLANELPYRAEQHALRGAIAFLSGLSPTRIELLATGTFVYASLFIVEGYGLWRGRYWAEWLTVIATSSLIPFEVYELARHPTLNKVGVIVGNVLILGYLVWRVRREYVLRRQHARDG